MTGGFCPAKKKFWECYMVWRSLLERHCYYSFKGFKCFLGFKVFKWISNKCFRDFGVSFVLQEHQGIKCFEGFKGSEGYWGYGAIILYYKSYTLLETKSFEGFNCFESSGEVAGLQRITWESFRLQFRGFEVFWGLLEGHEYICFKDNSVSFVL